MSRYDVIIAGAGLSGLLTAWRLKTVRPGIRLLVVDSETQLSPKTWSFHDSDLPGDSADWFLPLVSKRWSHHSVRFPAYARMLRGGYGSLTSADLESRVAERLQGSLRRGVWISAVEENAIFIGEERLEADLVLDARGVPPLAPEANGYQKFVGMEIETEWPHGLDAPVLMDVAVPQTDGFRFFYLLPFSANGILIEDTHYSDTPELDVAAYRQEILHYAARRGWKVGAVLREEQGALPIPLWERFCPGGSPEEAVALSQVPCIGMRAGAFHPTTGYSLPDTLRIAEAVNALPTLSTVAALAALTRLQRSRNRMRPFYRLLNRLLFLAAEPGERWRILEKFYTLSEPAIRRFYAGESTWWDVARIMTGRPPVPLTRAFRVLAGPRPTTLKKEWA